jgi:hypothetical protein
MLPDDQLYYSPMMIIVYDSNKLGCCSYLGTHILPTVAPYRVEFETQEERAAKMKFIVFPKIKKLGE